LLGLPGRQSGQKLMSVCCRRRRRVDQGYALVEYATKAEAEAAIKGTNNTEFLEQTIRTYVPQPFPFTLLSLNRGFDG
jgi:hypothetical protein